MTTLQHLRRAAGLHASFQTATIDCSACLRPSAQLATQRRHAQQRREAQQQAAEGMNQAVQLECAKVTNQLAGTEAAALQAAAKAQQAATAAQQAAAASEQAAAMLAKASSDGDAARERARRQDELVPVQAKVRMQRAKLSTQQTKLQELEALEAHLREGLAQVGACPACGGKAVGQAGSCAETGNTSMQAPSFCRPFLRPCCHPSPQDASSGSPDYSLVATLGQVGAGG